MKLVRRLAVGTLLLAFGLLSARSKIRCASRAETGRVVREDGRAEDGAEAGRWPVVDAR